MVSLSILLPQVWRMLSAVALMHEYEPLMSLATEGNQGLLRLSPDLWSQ